jgi:hypothetical protein
MPIDLTLNQHLYLNLNLLTEGIYSTLTKYSIKEGFFE